MFAYYKLMDSIISTIVIILIICHFFPQPSFMRSEDAMSWPLPFVFAEKSFMLLPMLLDSTLHIIHCDFPSTQDPI